MLLRYFWEEWMERKDYGRYPTLEDYVNERIQLEFGTTSWNDAQISCLQKNFKNYIKYDARIFGPYPELLKPHLEKPKYRLIYEGDRIVGRQES
jgi:hypothetical protein